MVGEMKKVVFLVVATLVISSATAAATDKSAVVISPFCTSATINATGEDNRVLCTQWIKGAKTWPEAMTNVIKTVVGIANATKPIALDIIVEQLAAIAVELEPIISTCSKAFDMYVHYRGECIGLVKDDPYSDIYTHFFSPSFRLCKEALLELRISVPEIDQFDVDKKLNNIVIAVWESKRRYKN